jgi:hypothetical protein
MFKTRKNTGFALALTATTALLADSAAAYAGGGKGLSGHGPFGVVTSQVGSAPGLSPVVRDHRVPPPGPVSVPNPCRHHPCATVVTPRHYDPSWGGNVADHRH